MENNQKMDGNPKNQVVERLRDAQNVLITVSNDPSVDQLSAAIGFTLLMNKLGKHATAVFSGKVPSTIEFLKPEATLEQNTDSLRDFIISLDKSKADKLRYKVEENVVKIFITPYRTSLDQADFDFSQGDFNVDVVVALGVDKQEHIDQAIKAHGRILHDATVIGIMPGPIGVDLGNINWQDPSASSLCEMLVSISEAFQSGLLDSQMATAFLTGIVAETDRFSNDRTTSKIMTIAAQLMAAGANQQLIATKLTLPPDPPKPPEVAKPDLSPPPATSAEGVISLHDQPGAKQLPAPPKVDQISIDDQGELHVHDIKDQTTTLHDVKSDASETDAVQTTQPDDKQPDYSKYVSEPPQSGGTLTANSRLEALDPSTDPLSDIPQASTTDLTIDDSSKPWVDTKPALPNISPSDDDNQDQPLGPFVDEPKDTLDDIEVHVKQYEKTVGKKEMPDPNTARQAVDNAVTAAGPDFDRPEPIQALNAQPFPEYQHPVDSQAAPPSVPPPLPIPLPPEDEQIDGSQPADQNQDKDDNLPPLPNLS
jgi:hypothetical protein